MQVRRFIPTVLASVALSGCAGLSGLLGASGGLTLSTGQKLVNDSVSALQADQDARAGTAMVTQGSTTQSLGLSASASASAEASGSIDDGCDCEDATASARFDERAKALWQNEQGVVQTVSKSSQTNSDGSVTTTFQAQVETKGVVRQIDVVKTVSASGSLMALDTEIQAQTHSGLKSHLSRILKVNADGTWTLTFSRTSEYPDGKTTTITWTANGNPDGSETAEGRMTLADGTETTVALSRDASGMTVFKDIDAQAGVAVEIDQPDLETSAEAKITSIADAKVLSDAQVSDTTSVEAAEN